MFFYAVIIISLKFIMRIYIIAAEPSSDYIASKLVSQMKVLNKNLTLELGVEKI